MDNAHPLNKILPIELTNKIENMACRKVVNGDKRSNELIIRLDLNENASDVHDELIQWVLKCMDTISHKVDSSKCDPDYNSYEWNIISQILDNDYEEDYDLDEQGNYTKLTNTIIIAIHITDNSFFGTTNGGLTIPYDYHPKITLSSQEIMDCLIHEPIYVKGIGISAVSSDVMMGWWGEMISTHENVFDLAGKGYMVHPMWMKLGDGWDTIREKSYNFGWKGYIHALK